MSRIGKQLITIPSGVTATLENGVLRVKGPLGELTRNIIGPITGKIENNVLTFTPNHNAAKALWGTYAAHAQNMIAGVQKKYEKKLLLEGVGYKWAVEGTTLNMALGFSHPIKLVIPEGLTVTIDKTGLLVTGIDKDLVGSFTAKIRSQRKPEPYKGKGIRYDGEVIRRKQGKKSV